MLYRNSRQEPSELVTCPSSHRHSGQTHLPRGSESLSCFVPSAGCFFGEEVRGSGTESAPSDTDASSEVERQGPERPLPKESLDNSRNLKGSSSKGHESSRNTEDPMENACLAEGQAKAPETSGPDECHGPAPTPAELPWTNIDLKEPKKASNQPAAGFPETSGLSSLGLFPMGMEEPYGADDHPLWAWVSGGGCAVEAGSALKWFTVQSGKGTHGAGVSRMSPWPFLGAWCGGEAEESSLEALWCPTTLTKTLDRSLARGRKVHRTVCRLELSSKSR